MVAQLTKRILLKLYPKATRTGSSNMNPIKGWSCGAQAVAMNMQTVGEEMDLYNGMFAQNGRRGYIPKPKNLLEEILVEPSTPKLFLNVKIISGQCLPKPSKRTEEVVDPYVTVEIFGYECDCSKKRTASVHNNGILGMETCRTRLLSLSPVLCLSPSLSLILKQKPKQLLRRTSTGLKELNTRFPISTNFSITILLMHKNKFIRTLYSI